MPFPPPSPLSPLDILRSQTLTRLVQEEVIRRIKTGELVAGAKLNELELAERLKISRSPAREAFAALEEAGLVRLEKNRGAFVRELSDGEAAELYEVRRGLDEMAGRLLAACITDAQLVELRRILTTLDAAERDGIDRYFTLNIAFHDRLVEMTGNATLLGLYRQLINRMHLLRRQGFSLAGSGAASRTEHRLILEALDRRDPEAAARHMGNHVAQGYRRFKQASEAGRDSGSEAGRLLGV